MSATLTMLRKELHELVGERVSRRSGLIQSCVIIVILGVLGPSKSGAMWRAGSPLAVVYFISLPAILAVTIAADAFAGERERKTLETLLATPLSERSILFGKGIAAVLFALSATAVAFVCAVATVNLTSHPHSPNPAALFIPAPELVVGVFGGVLATSSLTSAVAILVSLKVPVARSVQQITSLSTMVLFSGIAALWGAVGLALTWRNVLVVELVLFLVAAGLFEVARATFQRDRIFDKR